jgi:hypothetical protein
MRWWDGSQWTEQTNKGRGPWWKLLLASFLGLMVLAVIAAALGPQPNSGGVEPRRESHSTAAQTRPEVPSLIGLTRAEAETKAKAARARLSVEGGTSQGDEKVCEQDPEAGSEHFKVTGRFGLACEKVRRSAATLRKARKTKLKHIAARATGRARKAAKAATLRKKAAGRRDG